MFKTTYCLVLTLVLLFLFSFVANAGNYLDGVLLRARGDIKVYLINNNTKRWVSSIEVFNFNNFKWRDVKIVSKKEITAIKESSPIVLESVSPAPVSTPSTGSGQASSPQASPSTTPTISVSPTPPIPAKINTKFPAPDYIRADWLISHVTSNYGRIGQKIVFKYSDKEINKVENFRLYEKKPSDKYFYKVAEFEKIPSTSCKDIDIDGEWMMTEAGQCGYWFIQKTVLPGGRDAVAYLSAANFLAGEYGYYVAGVDKDGLETAPSPEAKLVFLAPVDILSPVDDQPISEIYPIFKWTVTGDWPEDSTADYFLMISDDKNAQGPIWAKQLKVSLGETGKQLTYDGLGLNPNSKYKVNVYGHYRKSEHDPDYISIPSVIPEFLVKPSNSRTSFVEVIKALFFGIFDLSR